MESGYLAIEAINGHEQDEQICSKKCMLSLDSKQDYETGHAMISVLFDLKPCSLD